MAKLKKSGTHAAGGRLSRRQLLVGGAVLSAGMALPGARSVLAQGSSEPFRFGLIKALTGRVASAYAPLYVGPRIALEEINASGGILGRKVVIIEDDDEGAPAKEPAVVRALQEKENRHSAWSGGDVTDADGAFRHDAGQAHSHRRIVC